MFEQVECNLCGSKSYAVIYKTYSEDKAIEAGAYEITDHSRRSHLQIVKCRECGFVYSNPRPSLSSLKNNYINMIDETYIKEENGRRMSAQFILKAIKKYKRNGRLLDIGCATGFLLDEARKEGWQVYGIELSKWAVDFAKEKLGMADIFRGTLSDAGYQDNFFDVIIMKDTIEHLTDVKATLLEIERILKLDGLLYISAPDFDSLASKLLRTRWWNIEQSHLQYFTRRTLHKMLNIANFKAEEAKPIGRMFTLTYWIDQFDSYNKTISKFFMFLIKHKIINNNLIHINFRDQIEVCATKIRRHSANNKK